MNTLNIKALKNQVYNSYLNKGYEGEQLEDALYNDSLYPKDRLIEVTGYDLSNNKILGLLDNKKCEVTICPTAFSDHEEKLAQTKSSEKVPNSWSGIKIDENMAKNIPVKSQLLLLESVMDIDNSLILIVASQIAKIAPPNKKDLSFSFAFSTYPPVENPKISIIKSWEHIDHKVVVSQIIDNLRNKSSTDNNIKIKKP